VALLFNFLALLFVVVAALLQWYGTVHSYYFFYIWWDIPTHFFAGLSIGLWFMAVATRLRLSERPTLWLALSLLFMVGIAWELWEKWMGLEGGLEGYYLDTLFDLIVDLLGAFVAWILYYVSNKKPAA
jgi:hypothetical protein